MSCIIYLDSKFDAEFDCAIGLSFGSSSDWLTGKWSCLFSQKLNTKTLIKFQPYMGLKIIILFLRRLLRSSIVFGRKVRLSFDSRITTCQIRLNYGKTWFSCAKASKASPEPQKQAHRSQHPPDQCQPSFAKIKLTSSYFTSIYTSMIVPLWQGQYYEICPNLVFFSPDRG